MGLGGILIEDDQINEAFKGTNFGPNMEAVGERRKAVAKAVLKSVCDYRNGHTMVCIMQELGLTKTLNGKPTKAARRWMYEVLLS
ncbi:MAG: hypothetical protein WCZ86_03955 [Desulfurivibrionaceae bacterium]|jgi:hypothetical protein